MGGTGSGSIKPGDKRAGNKGVGRPKGVQNKLTKALKEMIREALDKAGGVTYLVKQAKENPGPFLALLGKILPTEVVGKGGGAIQFEKIERIIIDHADQVPAEREEPRVLQ